MATRPSNRNLLIPGKNALGSDYKKDAQTLEQWARQPIQQLKAGSGITLSPASGLATDSRGYGPNPVTISASGGGGGGGIEAVADINAGPEGMNSTAPTNGQWFPFTPTASGVFSITPIPLWQQSDGATGGDTDPAFSSTWFTILAAGQSANILPILLTPAFSGGTGTIGFKFWYWAVSTSYANGALYLSHTINVGPSTSHQIVVADLGVVVVAFGADLTLTAGTGDTGNGLVSAGAGVPYLAGVSGGVSIPPGTTFP